MISQLAGWMTFVGGIHIVLGFIMVAASLSAAAGCVYLMLNVDQLPVPIPVWLFGIGIAGASLYALLGAVIVAEGGFLFKARGSLRAVAESDVADQQYLSDAFQKIRIYFLLEVALGALSIVVSLLQIGLAFMSRAIVPVLEGLQNGAGS